MVLLKKKRKYKTISSLFQIKEPITNRTLILLDIDNTVITADHYGVSLTCFEDSIEHFMKSNYYTYAMNKNFVRDMFYPIWVELNEIGKVRLVNPNDLNFIKAHEEQTHFLTARRPSMMQVTIKQFNDVGIPLGPIYFLGDQKEKGEFFRTRSKTLKTCFDKIIFIDDYGKNLESVEKACKEEKIKVSLYKFDGDTYENRNKSEGK